MTIKDIIKKYGCSHNDAVNIQCKLNTPEQLGLTAKSYQKKVEDKLTKK